MIKKLALIASVSLLASCADLPERPAFADTKAKNEAFKVEKPDRISIELEYDCPDDICQVPAEDLSKLVGAITDLQDERELRIDGYNQSIDSLTHCEYANRMLDYSLGLEERRADKIELSGTIKQTISGLLLITGVGLCFSR